jgi:DNA-binding NtrC family response regulator
LILRKKGCDVVFCGEQRKDILKAIAQGKLTKYNLDIVLLDYWLGDSINCLQTAARIMEHIPTVKIIIATGESSIKTQILKAELSFLLEQPFSIEEFLISSQPNL